MTLDERLAALCTRITDHYQDRLKKLDLACEANMQSSIARYSVKQKYIYIDVGSSGRYMIDRATEVIYGIKGYGVIHRGHSFGTIDNPVITSHWG